MSGIIGTQTTLLQMQKPSHHVGLFICHHLCIPRSLVAEILNLCLSIAVIKHELKQLQNSTSITLITPQYPFSPLHIAYFTTDVPCRYLECANAVQHSHIVPPWTTCHLIQTLLYVPPPHHYISHYATICH